MTVKINAPKDKYIFIELTHEDMKRMNITYEQMDYSDMRTRAVIDSLLEEARKSLGYSLSLPDKVRIDALPSFDGGCLLFFTVSNKPVRYKLKAGGVQLSFEFDKPEHIFDLAASLTAKEREGLRTSLYVYEGKNVLFIEGKLKHSLVARINEYALPVKTDAHTRQVIREYGKCIAKGNALEILGSCLSE